METTEFLEQLDINLWIKKKVREYHESSRAGVPRGDSLPVPKHKYHAALLMLVYGGKYFCDLSQVSEETGCSYNLLAKWRTERKFWALAEEAADEFLKTYLGFYVHLADAKPSNPDDDNGWDDLAREQGKMLSLVEQNWGDVLFERAYEKLDKMSREPKISSKALTQLYYLMIACARHWKDDELKFKIIDRCKEMNSELVAGFKDAAKVAWAKGDKRAAEGFLEIIANWAIEGNNDFLDMAFGSRRKQG
ncbi:MAG: hypothetical protein WC687_04410 [Patescibacteria group bacterium]|jgi:hypothetical protein